MKKLSLSALIILTATTTFALTEIPVTTKVKKATVFLRGAEIERSSTVRIPAGVSEIVFEYLSDQLNQQSIQVNAGNKVTILSVNYRRDFLKAQKRSKAWQLVNDSIEIVKLERTKINNKKIVLAAEESMLKANQKIGGINTGTSVTELQRAIEYFNKRMTLIQDGLMKYKLSDVKLKKILDRLQKQLVEINQKENRPAGEVVVQVSAKSAVTTRVELSYLVFNAGWTPSYDLRAKDIKSPVDLIYKAAVYQNTGVDWEQAQLTISTGNPTVSATSPTLSTWWIDFVEYAVRNKAYQINVANEMQQAMAIVLDKDSPTPPTTIVETAINTFFDIEIPYDIPSDGKTHIVSMKEFELPAQYKYYAVPKLDRDAFLLANVTNWENLSLLPGQTNIFFEGTYVGQSFIDPRVTTSDTLSFSLGRDKRITIKREKVVDLCSSTRIGANKKEVVAYQVSVRNNKSESIKIKILDQIPISKNKDIVVSLQESSGAIYDVLRGELSWDLELGPGERKKMNLIYQVKYPKDKVIPQM